MTMMLDSFSDAIANMQAWLFQGVVQPVMFHIGLAGYLEEAFDGTEWFLIGVCELIVLYLVLRPLEAAIPVHAITDRRARWIDFIYTVIQRLGAFSVLAFFLLDPIVAEVSERLHLLGANPFNLDNLWSGMIDYPIIGFFVYLIVIDFFEYWYHWAQHNVGWMWGLHSLHHSQQNMNLWSDDRNHLLDDVIHSVYLAVVALLIGVEPGQYVLLVSVSRMLQSLQHANVRIHFGWFDRVLVSPRFHRWHHAVGVGHESAGRALGGHNFAVLFAFWDILFRSHYFGKGFVRTGIRDQLPPPHGCQREYGQTFWTQQWLGLKRMVAFASRNNKKSRFRP
jgi:sterol desaturase/sphingolipid hydroxylase (fatty acid hydroxylase superfamily)